MTTPDDGPMSDEAVFGLAEDWTAWDADDLLRFARAILRHEGERLIGKLRHGQQHCEVVNTIRRVLGAG